MASKRVHPVSAPALVAASNRTRLSDLRLAHLRALECKILWLAVWMIHHANQLRPKRDFLKVGGVFTDDLIEAWIHYKRVNEVDALRLRPHPWEFHLYYDI